METNELRQKLLLLLGIHFFKELEMKENYPELSSSSDLVIKAEKQLIKEFLSFLLMILKNVGKKKFYFTFEADLKHSLLCYQSEYDIFPVINT